MVPVISFATYEPWWLRLVRRVPTLVGTDGRTRWLHASERVFAAGAILRPPSKTGLAPSWADGTTLHRSIRDGTYRSSFVYVFPDEGAPIRDHIGRFGFIKQTSNVYEVRPLGRLRPDPMIGHGAYHG